MLKLCYRLLHLFKRLFFSFLTILHLFCFFGKIQFFIDLFLNHDKKVSFWHKLSLKVMFISIFLRNLMFNILLILIFNFLTKVEYSTARNSFLRNYINKTLQYTSENFFFKVNTLWKTKLFDIEDERSTIIIYEISV